MCRTVRVLAVLGLVLSSRSSFAEDTSIDDTSTEDTSIDDTSSDDTSADDASADGTSSEDTSTDDTSSDDTSTDDTSIYDTSIDDTSSDDASNDDTSVDETLFELAPTSTGLGPRTCSRDSSVVGYGCPPYGVWGAALEAPYMLIGIGFNARRLPRHHNASTTIARGTGESTVAPLESDTSFAISQTMAIVLSSVSFIGLEVEVAPAVAETVAPGQRSMAAGAALVLGLRGGGSTLTLGVQLAGGVRVVDSKEVINGDEPVLEARAHGDLWITPWFTIGALVGASLIDPGDLVTGIQLGFHSWAYGGR